MRNIVVLYGGRSTEHEIALRSAKTVLNHLDRKKYRVYGYFISKQGHFVERGEVLEEIIAPEDLVQHSDDSLLASVAKFCRFLDGLEAPLVFPVIHGQTGEDGEIQGFLQSLGVNYIGNRIMASALCMDKGFANQVLRESGLPKAPFFVLTRKELESSSEADLIEKIRTVCSFPCFVKPCNNGSSVGVNRADEKNLMEAIREAMAYDNRIVIEKEIVGVELELSILGTNRPKSSQAGSYTSSREIFDYTAKYNDAQTVQNVPHYLDEEKLKEVQDLALRSYAALDCEGLARVDIFMDKQGQFYINEINTLPGMTPTSLAPKLWISLTGSTMSDYLDELVDYAEESLRRRQGIKTSWGQ